MESSHSGTSTVNAKSIKYSIKRNQTNNSCVPHDSLKMAERISLCHEVLFLKGNPPVQKSGSVSPFQVFFFAVQVQMDSEVYAIEALPVVSILSSGRG